VTFARPNALTRKFHKFRQLGNDKCKTAYDSEFIYRKTQKDLCVRESDFQGGQRCGLADMGIGTSFYLCDEFSRPLVPRREGATTASPLVQDVGHDSDEPRMDAATRLGRSQVPPQTRDFGRRIMDRGGPDAHALLIGLIRESRNCQDEAVTCAGEQSACQIAIER
jgi:hypothetical protein